jgi:hypothetical protein
MIKILKLKILMNSRRLNMIKILNGNGKATLTLGLMILRNGNYTLQLKLRKLKNLINKRKRLLILEIIF